MLPFTSILVDPNTDSRAMFKTAVRALAEFGGIFMAGRLDEARSCIDSSSKPWDIIFVSYRLRKSGQPLRYLHCRHQRSRVGRHHRGGRRVRTRRSYSALRFRSCRVAEYACREVYAPTNPFSRFTIDILCRKIGHSLFGLSLLNDACLNRAYSRCSRITSGKAARQPLLHPSLSSEPSGPDFARAAGCTVYAIAPFSRHSPFRGKGVAL